MGISANSNPPESPFGKGGKITESHHHLPRFAKGKSSQNYLKHLPLFEKGDSGGFP